MNPLAMAVIIVGLLAVFAYSARNRLALLRVGGPTHEPRTDRLGERVGAVWTFALFQKKMRYYLAAGIGHQLIFAGFVVLLANSVILWGRGFDPTFSLWVLAPGTTLGDAYGLLRDLFSVLVLAGVLVFVYFRVISPQRRMNLHWEGLFILGIISTMMIGDLLYNGAALALASRVSAECAGGATELCRSLETITAPFPRTASVAFHPYPEPAGSAVAVALSGLDSNTLLVLGHAGFWVHASLVLGFMNLLPYSKHFHILTAVPNVFLSDRTPPGRLRPIAKSAEEMMAMVEKASELPEMSAAPIGYARIEHFTWKDMLDLYTCTECGRCSDNCPAHNTGKILSPKHLTLDLRDHLYSRQEEAVALGGEIPRLRLEDLRPGAGGEADAPKGEAGEPTGGDAGPADTSSPAGYQTVDLVPNIIHEDVLWACTTCRACEEQCPVLITYVDKIVQMRRNLASIKGEFPAQLQAPFNGMETNGNPWNLSRLDRASWSEGLGVPTLAEKPEAAVLYWVGCAASYDDRAKKVARATAALLAKAGVDFAVLGEEETCTGDPARRAGNEFLFLTLAEQNAATLQGYREKGGVKTIVTTCPHCFNSLANEYPDFGARFDVVHHTDYLLGLVSAGKLAPRESVKAKVAYHDSCYLGRYNQIYESPREILRRIPGVEVVEVEHWQRNRGLCCGAGGAQMWMEEQNKDRVNVKRTEQLLATGASTLATACPFCMTMLTDGIKSKELEGSVKNLDVAELLAVACGVDPAAPAASA
ncbi:MAG: (Fe-S)-binding protein [Polyangiaceae bacterium]|nr:(Fe-S)-binding protein [Polyangiaceae bacterium]